MKFRCWDPEVQEEDDGLEIESSTPSTAAEAFADKRFASDSYPMQRTVHVLVLDVKVFDVETRQNPEFHATERQPK